MPPAPLAAAARDNLRGAGLMMLAMAGFTAEDLLVRAATRVMPVGEALALFGLAGMVLFAAIARVRGEPILHAAMRHRALWWRGGAEIAGRVGYTMGLALLPFSAISSILQAAPLVVVAGAALLFGERVSAARWAAIVAGFGGVLLILQPGGEGFTPAALWAVLGMAGFSGRDLATRAAPPVLTNAQLGVIGFANLILAGAVITAFTVPPVLPSAAGLGLVLGAAVVGVAAYSCLTGAMRCGDVAVVTPFRYVRLPLSLVIAALWLGERPDAMMLAGSAVILAAGLYTLLSVRRPAPGTLPEGVDPRA